MFIDVNYHTRAYYTCEPRSVSCKDSLHIGILYYLCFESGRYNGVHVLSICAVVQDFPSCAHHRDNTSAISNKW